MTREEREIAITNLEGIKRNYIEGYGYEEHPLPEYYAIEAGIEALKQEPKTKNCESCRYYGSHHEVCNYCYNFSLWTEQEPTTKNDLGVDKSILALLEKTYTDFYKCAGGEGWFEIDGKTYGTDAGYALEGMDIFMEVFKQRLAESEPQESEDKE